MQSCCLSASSKPGGGLQAEGAGRDVLLLDIALDNYFRLCIERTDKSSLSGDDLLDMVDLVLSNACIAGESQDFGQVCLINIAASHVFPVCLFAWANLMTSVTMAVTNLSCCAFGM